MLHAGLVLLAIRRFKLVCTTSRKTKYIRSTAVEKKPQQTGNKKNECI